MIFFEKNNFKDEALKIIDNYKISDFSYSLTYDNKKNSYFALLFAVFISYLTSNFDKVFKDSEKLKEQILTNLEKYSKIQDVLQKPYLQLLTLTLSALYLIDGRKINYTDKFINNVKNNKIITSEYLSKFKCLDGEPSSGNYAMFIGIVLIYLNEYLGIDKQKEIDNWITLHLKNMNDFGLWGKNKNLYCNFQNGYHQYEIIKFLKLKNFPIDKTSNAVKELMNNYGGFAPYPGGGACYDYDAIFFLTINEKNNYFLRKNINKLIKNFEQNYFQDLGFSENIFCRPLNLKNTYRLLLHPIRKIDNRTKEKFLSTLSILRSRNRLIKNHWSEKPYYWQKPNLFATWFRVMSIAKLDQSLNLNTKWNFIKFPGIGY